MKRPWLRLVAFVLLGCLTSLAVFAADSPTTQATVVKHGGSMMVVNFTGDTNPGFYDFDFNSASDEPCPPDSHGKMANAGLKEKADRGRCSDGIHEKTEIDFNDGAVITVTPITPQPGGMKK